MRPDPQRATVATRRKAVERLTTRRDWRLIVALGVVSCVAAPPGGGAGARATPAAAQAPDSIVENGSMELGEKGAVDDVVADWQIPPEVVSAGKRTWSPADAHSGKYGKGLRSYGEQPFFDIQLLDDPSLPGSDVILSGWLRSNQRGSRVTVRLRWTADGFVDLAPEPLPDGEWHFFSQRVAIPSKVQQLAVACIVGGRSNGSFDDVSLEKASTGPAAVVDVAPTDGFFIGLPLGSYRGERDLSETLDLLRDSGMNLLHVHSTWAQLEKAPGQIRIAGSGGLENAQRFAPRYPELEGLVVVLTVIETNVKTLPRDLSARPFDDPALIWRFETLIDTLAELPVAKRMRFVLVGNEVDAYLSKNHRELEPFATFLERATTRIRSRMPHVATGTIFTAQGVRGFPDIFDRLSRLGDLVVYTYYPFAPQLRMRPNDEVARDLESLAQRAAGRPFAFTEIGCASSPVNGSSEAHQAAFVRQMFTSLDPSLRRSQLRFLHYMTTFDPPDDFTRDYAQSQGVLSPAFMSFMTSLGLRRYEGGTPKEAWSVFVAGAAAWRSAKPLPPRWRVDVAVAE